MKVFEFNAQNVDNAPTILVLGYFDGLHRGHQTLFDKARELAAEKKATISVLTFPESPILVFEKFNENLLKQLTSKEKRNQLFEENGVDFLYFTDFTSHFAKLTSHDFIEKYLKKLAISAIVIGFDYQFGSDHGSLAQLSEYDAYQVSELTDMGEKISSSRIRQAIIDGDVTLANRLLGYNYEISGLVVHGEARGRTIGYPTANIESKSMQYLPLIGVYVVDIAVGDKKYRGMASIGYNDTFGGKNKTLEVNIFDFHDEIYGETVTVYFLKFIRGMIKFDSVDALITQMDDDEKISRYF
ncbi:bifunctional riboflavin kinase/FAD synthetase [Pseudolactococcus paracarnosus]|uniref:Riboflavin biosynthesis protein n=1 Tax=Pseudolactococcus paracarnosus TaxID=2749962 RepID=A0A7L4WEE4_9LACT|nr:bifunctional riboflavin kinase/FAD synthetase [Lactococcus paracarnosus]SPC35777.1 Riboflavin kinase / FMN adenylyltransferase [Lactococcus piscium]MCJ1976528.1 bifunctional riboflavin kinase/FAD synthetase [Lactococcus paracarnosus]MCJ1982681.1 bifunctional riboflavin kinase/FAD synthetase [Lactococcus paracarnosus]MCJ1994517.1 bifunctional riboflavin kinase/FAD synthetase [Lactococcus paracarnosus]MCJ1997703.1 bifunctional riboflavin kinase/FAD synthetase [Lactococcus paracarnosus]